MDLELELRVAVVEVRLEWEVEKEVEWEVEEEVDEEVEWLVEERVEEEEVRVDEVLTVVQDSEVEG